VNMQCHSPQSVSVPSYTLEKVVLMHRASKHSRPASAPLRYEFEKENPLEVRLVKTSIASQCQVFPKPFRVLEKYVAIKAWSGGMQVPWTTPAETASFCTSAWR
jgi:hypothetical protein